MMPSDIGQQTDEPDWTIGTIEEAFGPAGPGGTVRYKRVNFTVRGGQSSYVDVPMTGDWKTAAVQAVAQHASDILALSGTKSTDF